MIRISRGACALLACMFAGCATPQTPIAMPDQSHATGPLGIKGDLLYVDEGYRTRQSESGRVAIYTYPDLKLVEKFTVSKPGAPPAGTTGMCSDAQGDVFIGGDYDQNAAIYEYAHGGTAPIAVLNDGAYDANDCAVDGITGNLAVVNYVTGNTSANVSIFQNAQGNPTIYTDPGMVNYLSCTYDDNGNLFVDGTTSTATQIVELPAGSSTFTSIALNVTLGSTGAVLWRKGLLVIQDQAVRKLYSVRLSGSSGTVVATTRVRQKGPSGELDYIYNDRVIAPDGNHLAGGQVGIWPYPAGGHPITVFSTGNVVNPYSATISAKQ